jgi:FtsH-binding integral membrane protein
MGRTGLTGPVSPADDAGTVAGDARVAPAIGGRSSVLSRARTVVRGGYRLLVGWVVPSLALSGCLALIDAASRGLMGDPNVGQETQLAFGYLSAPAVVAAVFGGRSLDRYVRRTVVAAARSRSHPQVTVTAVAVTTKRGFGFMWRRYLMLGGLLGVLLAGLPYLMSDDLRPRTALIFGGPTVGMLLIAVSAVPRILQPTTPSADNDGSGRRSSSGGVATALTATVVALIALAWLLTVAAYPAGADTATTFAPSRMQPVAALLIDNAITVPIGLLLVGLAIGAERRLIPAGASR